MKLFQLFFIFLVAPAFTNGIKCGYGGICYGRKNYNVSPFPLVSKECSDACVAFKCVTSGFVIMEGAGCYEDFDRTCKYILSNKKDVIQANIGNYNILQDRTVDFHSCNTSENCATNNSLNPWKIVHNGYDYYPFGQYYYPEISKTDLTCEFDAEPKTFKETVQCKTLKSCESAKEYGIGGGYKKSINGPAKFCDACVRYECTNDAGKTVNLGYGCYEDFEAACTTVPSNVKENIKKNINDSLYYDAKMYKVFTCRDEDNCHIWSSGLNSYDSINEIKLEVDVNSDRPCSELFTTTTDSLSTTTVKTTTAPSSTSTTPKPQPEIQPTEAPILSPIDYATSDSTVKPTDPTGGATFNEFGMKFFGLILLSFFIGFIE